MKYKSFIGRGLQIQIAAYFLLVGVLLMLTNHGDVVLWLNERHSSVGDFFFKYWTYLGDGVLLGLVALIYLLRNYYAFFTMLVAIAIQTVLVHIFKQWLYAGEPRPKTYFADQLSELNFVEGVRVNAFDSFPSGHTAAAFTLALILIWRSSSKAMQSALFIAAVLVGISRVYLLQHFLVDIYIGSAFGILSVLIAWFIMRKYEGRENLQRGLLPARA